MRIWLLRVAGLDNDGSDSIPSAQLPEDFSEYIDAHGFVIIAENEAAARIFAAEASRQDWWRDSAMTACTEVTADTPRIVMGDYPTGRSHEPTQDTLPASAFAQRDPHNRPVRAIPLRVVLKACFRCLCSNIRLGIGANAKLGRQIVRIAIDQGPIFQRAASALRQVHAPVGHDRDLIAATFRAAESFQLRDFGERRFVRQADVVEGDEDRIHAIRTAAGDRELIYAIGEDVGDGGWLHGLARDPEWLSTRSDNWMPHFRSRCRRAAPSLSNDSAAFSHAWTSSARLITNSLVARSARQIMRLALNSSQSCLSTRFSTITVEYNRNCCAARA
jgi:hypothetical protein